MLSRIFKPINPETIFAAKSDFKHFPDGFEEEKKSSNQADFNQKLTPKFAHKSQISQSIEPRITDTRYKTISTQSIVSTENRSI